MTGVQPTILSLTSWADEIRAREFARRAGKLATLSPRDRRLVEKLAARIVREFLHEPIAQMRTVAVAPSGIEYAGVVRYLFGEGDAR